MPKIFLSHAHEDKEIAHQIYHVLAAAGLELWLDAQELKPGDELLKSIAAGIDQVDYFGVVLTAHALTKRWVLEEMRIARTSEIERGRPKVMVFRLDDCKVPIELGHKLYLDFRGSSRKRWVKE